MTARRQLAIVLLTVLPVGAHAGVAGAASPAAVAVPASTRTLPATAVRVVAGAPSAPRSLVLAPGAAAGLRSGDILALGAGPNLPYGLLARVRRLRSTAAGTVVTTSRATLAQAVPDGRLAVSRRIAASASTGLSPQALVRARALGSCGAGVGLADVGPDASLTGTLVLSATWHTPPASLRAELDEAHFAFTGSLRLAVAPDLPALPACSFDLPLPGDVQLAPIHARVGRVPVVIAPRVTFVLHGENSVSGLVFYRASGTFSASVGVTYARRRFHPAGRVSGRFASDYLSPGARLSSTTTIRAQLRVLVDGADGADLALAGGTALNADPAIAAPTPWWTLQGTVEGSGSLALERWLLPQSWAEPRLARLTQLVASASGSAAAPVNTGLPSIADLEGRAQPFVGDVLRAGAGGWTGSPAIAYQWQRCRSATTGCDDIAGATGDRYTVAVADAGSPLRVAVTGRNDVGARTAFAAWTGTTRLGATYAGLGAGLATACGIVAGGSVACWGSGDTVGDGTPSEPSVPTPSQPYTPQHVGIVSGLADATAVDGGSFALCAVRATGSVVCWGHTLQGGGIGNGSTSSSVPVPVTGIATATAVSVGEDTACALLAGGDAACWGWNGESALGDGTAVDRPLPVAVAGLHGALAISTGGAHSCALRSDHTVVCWGIDWHGMLAYDPITGAPSGPMVVVPGLSNVVAIDAGGYFTCALRANGTVSCWGDGAHGEAGDGTTLETSYVPSTVAGITDAVAIAVDRYHACALRAGGTVACWGGSDPGQDDGGLPDSALPVAIAGVSGAVAIRAGGDSTYALRPDGSILAWGVGDAHVAHAAPGL